MRCLLQNSQKHWQPRKYAKTNSACAADVRCNQKIKMDCVVICRLTTKLSDPMCMLSWMQGPLGRTAHHAHLTGVPVQTVRFKRTADKIWEPKPPQAARPTPEQTGTTACGMPPNARKAWHTCGASPSICFPIPPPRPWVSLHAPARIIRKHARGILFIFVSYLFGWSYFCSYCLLYFVVGSYFCS